MSWLQGGPFLEVSFIMRLETDRQSFVDNLFSKLKSFTPTIGFAISEHELQEKLAEFYTGYPDDETDPNTKVYHQAQIPTYVDTDFKRKSILSLQQISSKLIAVDFWFFGAETDAPEWGQKGISQGQVHLFKDMLHRLYDTFHFAIGTVGYENSVTDLFNTGETLPHESYSLNNINKSSVQVDNYFIAIIANKEYLQLQGIKGLKVTDDRMVLEV
jgi:hypothetical protein